VKKMSQFDEFSKFLETLEYTPFKGLSMRQIKKIIRNHED